MALTIKEILKFVLGTEEEKDFDTIDKFKEKFNDKKDGFISRAALRDTKSPEFTEFLPNAVGTITGKTLTPLKKFLKEIGVEVTAEELKDKPLEEIVDNVLTKASTTVKGKYTEYDTKLTQNASDAIKGWETKYQELEKKHSSLSGLHDTLKSKYDTDTKDFQGQLKNLNMTKVRTELDKKHLKLKSTITELERDGWMGGLEKRFKFELNDKQDNIDVLDPSTGQKIPSKKKAGDYMDYPEALETFGVEKKAWAENEGARRMNNNSIFGAGKGNQQQEKVDDLQTQTSDTTRKTSSRFSE